MNDAQTWTLIAGFLAVMAAMATMTLRMVRAEIAVLGATFNARIDGLEIKLDHLDRDVQTIVSRLMDG